MAPRLKAKRDTEALDIQVANMDRETKKLFWAPGSKNFSFCVDVMGENGPEPKRDAQNMPVYNNGFPVWVSQVLKFRPVCEKPEMFLSVFEWDESLFNAEAILAKLEALEASPASNVIGDREYQRSRNAEAFDARVAATAKDEEIGSLQQQLAKARAEIAALGGGRNDE